MKSLMLKSIAIFMILAVGFLSMSPFLQQVGAHDLSEECSVLDLACTAMFAMVEHYCYSSSWDPYICDAAWSALGSTSSARDYACYHDASEEH